MNDSVLQAQLYYLICALILPQLLMGTKQQTVTYAYAILKKFDRQGGIDAAHKLRFGSLQLMVILKAITNVIIYLSWFFRSF